MRLRLVHPRRLLQCRREFGGAHQREIGTAVAGVERCDHVDLGQQDRPLPHPRDRRQHLVAVAQVGDPRHEHLVGDGALQRSATEVPAPVRRVALVVVQRRVLGHEAAHRHVRAQAEARREQTATQQRLAIELAAPHAVHGRIVELQTERVHQRLDLADQLQCADLVAGGRSGERDGALVLVAALVVVVAPAERDLGVLVGIARGALVDLGVLTRGEVGVELGDGGRRRARAGTKREVVAHACR
ncbi:MAG: hypothetical protein U0168_11690 [Nannocystaceae bacterium]